MILNYSNWKKLYETGSIDSEDLSDTISTGLSSVSSAIDAASKPKPGAGEFTLPERPKYLFRIFNNTWQYQTPGKNGKSVDTRWQWVSNLITVKRLNAKHGKTADVWVDNPAADKITDSDKKQIIIAIKEQGRALGWTDNAIAAMVGNVGRENGFNPQYIYGPHDDPKTRATNFGIISWTGPRLKDVQSYLKSAGMLQANGSARKNTESVKAMVKFVNAELDKQGGNSSLMRDPAATTQQISKMLYSYIRYAMAPYNTPDPKNKFHVAKNNQWAASAKLSQIINYA